MAQLAKYEKPLPAEGMMKWSVCDGLRFAKTKSGCRACEVCKCGLVQALTVQAAQSLHRGAVTASLK